MVIPAGGFAIGSNTGNDYPSIGQTDKPNYVTAANNAAFNAVQATEVGDIVYLVGVDLEKGTIDDNATDELLWYQDGYVSNAKLTFTKPPVRRTSRRAAMRPPVRSTPRSARAIRLRAF